MPVLTLGEVLRGAAGRYARREAIVDGELRLSFAELDARVDRLAAGLRARGTQAGDVIAVLSQNCHQYLEIYFACARLGAVMCALNPRSSAEELGWTLEHCGARAVMVQAELQSTLGAAGARADVIVHDGDPLRPQWSRYDALLERPVEALPAGPSPAAPLLLLYTLKGTGKPLGALLSHENVLADTLAALSYCALSERDKLLQGMPLHHVAGLHILTIAALIRGITVVIARHWRAELVAELLVREACTLAVMVPTAMRQLLDSPDLARFDVRSLRTIVACAGQYDRALFSEAMYRLGAERMVFLYGLTEASPLVTIASSTGEALWKENCIGWPLWYNRVRVVRSDGSDAAPEEVGELWVKGPNVFLGYYKAPQASAAALTADGWLRTGDLARADAEGCLFFCGRLGGSIKTGGENVDALEVEQAILACSPEVRTVAVVGRADATWGERVVACCALHAGRSLEAETLRERLRGKLAGFKLPKEVHFVDRLPFTEAGALDRTRMNELLASLPAAR